MLKPKLCQSRLNSALCSVLILTTKRSLSRTAEPIPIIFSEKSIAYARFCGGATIAISSALAVWQDYEAFHLGRLIVRASANLRGRRRPPTRIVKGIFIKLLGDIELKLTAREVVYILRVL